jgi:hypothetical protein
MAIVGVHITKINATKDTSKTSGKVTINNNIGIKKVEDKEFSLGAAKQKGIKFVFEFSCNYEPKVGTIEFEGEVLFVAADDKTKELLTKWKEKKELGSDVMSPVLNAALNRCNIEALKLSQDLNLPIPIPLPKVEHAPKKPTKATKD